MQADETYVFDIEGMHCGSCVGRVEKAASAVDGVNSVVANLATNRISVTGGDSEDVALALGNAGYPATPVVVGRPRKSDGDAIEELRRLTFFAAMVTVPVVVLSMGGHMFPAFATWLNQTLGQQLVWFLQFTFATIVLFGPGRVFFKIGLPALLRGAPDMNSLVLLGAGAAWTFSTLVTFFPDLIPPDARDVYFEASAVIVTLILLGRLLEAGAKGRTGSAIERLVGLQPKMARRVVDGIATLTPIEELVVGDVIQLRPGEQVAVDGIIIDGTSFIDESMMTGEPMPVPKTNEDPVFAGTINGNGAVTYRATQVGAETLLSQIIQMVSEAQGAKLPVQDVINRITLWFVPTVLIIALVTVIAWWAFGPSLGHALVAGVSVLIIACPCAMGLATPTSIMVGMGRAAELGVLFRKGAALQSLQNAKTVAFDKTGTLTYGQPKVEQVILHSDLPKDVVLGIAAAIEQHSEHPLATAVCQAAASLELELPDATEITAIPGYGVTGIVDGQTVAVGAGRFMDRLDIDADRFLGIGNGTEIFVAIDGNVAAQIVVSDVPRPEAASVVGALQENGVRTVLITGDNKATANSIGTAVGIPDTIADVLPAGKVAALQTLGDHAVFVGDGINDAPVLAAAHVGIAVGTGTDVAIESADVVLMSGDLRGVVNAFAISRATMRNIKQNLIWAFGYNVLLIPVAAGVLYPATGMLLSPMLAAGAMALSSVFVVSNALRLRWVKPHQDATPAVSVGSA